MTVLLDENDNPLHPRVYLPRPPVTKDELWHVVRVLWGVKIPRKAVCEGHVAPFDAFAEGYFGNTANWALWYGSRGTGKSLMLALLALTKAAILEINIALLGGSMAQSQNVQEHIENLLLYPAAPSWAVAQQIQTQITFTGGNWIRPLPASQKTVRGPHPQMTCVAAWTKVNTLDGDIRIDELTLGQRIWVSDDLATPREGVVQQIIDQGWKDTIRVHGDYGDLTCTSDHDIHTARGWVPAGELQPGDVLTVWQPPTWQQLSHTHTVPEPITDMWRQRQRSLAGAPTATLERNDVRDLVGGVVRAVTPGVTCHVYDITTDAGNFYANGVLVHNCLDEIDEMDIKVYNAAMGQAMAKPNARGVVIPEMVVASSTWQNPVGTFQEVRDDALRKSLPVRTWCFKEVMLTEDNPTGWMEPAFIERKRASVPAELFRVEYELGEPAGGSRAFDLAKLNDAFVTKELADERHTGSDDEWVFAYPEPTGWYAVGADWAKEEDKTVIVVFRFDGPTRECVYVRAVNRRPWPEMIGYFNDTVNKYNAVAAHDGTGIGNVVNDLVDERAIKFLMVGRQRTEMLVNYITAVEKGKYSLPRNCPAFDAHKATTVQEVYAPGKWNSHLSDFVAAFALAHYAVEHGSPVAVAEGVQKTAYRPKFAKDIDPDWSAEVTVARDGDVRVTSEGDNPFLVV